MSAPYTRDGLEPTESAREYATRVGACVASEHDEEIRARVARAIVLRELKRAEEQLKRPSRLERGLRVVFGIKRGGAK